MGCLLVLLSLTLVACGGADPHAGTPVKLAPIPRSRTLVMDCAESGTCGGQIQDYDSFNPYLPGATSRTGYNFLYEPLYFYNAYREEDNLIPWIAQSHGYSDDYTEVTVRIRPGVSWSDGHPWTAHDLVYTIEMLKAHAPELTFSTDMRTWVRQAFAEDDLTARIRLTAPNPRFVFSYFTNNFDNGVPIVPRHVWERQDPTRFANLDPARGWPVVSGPYRLALSVPEQRVWDLRPDWWAARSGFHALPKVERLIYLPYMDETKRVQSILANHLDTCLDLRPPNIEAMVAGNPAVATWTGRQPPYGYLDWWPISLGFNDLEPPFSDPEIRWAINHAIDRAQLVEVGWQGSGSAALLPFPDFPPLRRYTSQVDDLLAEYPVGTHDLGRTAALMTRKGWTRDSGGYWTRDGQRLKVPIDLFSVFQDIGPVLVAQLQKGGFDASFRMTSDSYSRMTQGTAKAFIMGNGGSVRDPYYTLGRYHSRFVRPTGTAAEFFWRWADPEFDRLVDRMAQIPPEDPALVPLFRQAMSVWLRQLPAIPLLQWYHRVPHNQRYWRRWPTAADPYINSAYWHSTWLLVLLQLEPAS
jgi:peptide/nickel transport system substrate-binding protein